jgi:hypothetical protein
MNRTRNTGVVFIDSNVVTSPQNSGGALNSTTLTYLATNTQITGSVMTTSSVNFYNGFLSVPLGAPELTKNDFTFYVNGLSIENSAVNAFSASIDNTTSSLFINPSLLGYVLESSDEVTAVGKFLI